MKLIHTQKKTANRPFIKYFGVPNNWTKNNHRHNSHSQAKHVEASISQNAFVHSMLALTAFLGITKRRR